MKGTHDHIHRRDIDEQHGWEFLLTVLAVLGISCGLWWLIGWATRALWLLAR